MEARDELLRHLHFYAQMDAEVQAGRGAEIARLREVVDPCTGKPFTWEVLAVAAGLSRQGANQAVNRYVESLSSARDVSQRVDAGG